MEATPYRVAIVGLDLTKMDDAIVKYLPHLLKAFPLERVIFVHVAKELELPEELSKTYPDLIAPIDEGIAADIQKKVDPVFKDGEVEYDVVIQEGPPLDTFLRVAKIKNADLIVMGRKKIIEGSGLLAGHIVRKSPASMLFITEDSPQQLKNILLPIDFSRHSALTVKIAQVLKERTGAQLHFSHIYKIPAGFYKTGKSREQFSDIMKSHAEKDFLRFCKQNQLGDEYTCRFIESEDAIPKLIYQHAEEVKADLILIGSRGRTKSSALLIGSVVEKLMFEDADIPVFIAKNKGESMSFFEALMKI
ncbi:MAG: universal stress protein [Fulvivirga sp.]|nr:universal stress protein [Fulvivirga sp.]